MMSTGPRNALVARAFRTRFRKLWERADVGYRVGIIPMRHPAVGDIYLHRNRFNIPHSGGQHLLIYRAEPGSESVKALDALCAVAGAAPKLSSDQRIRRARRGARPRSAGPSSGSTPHTRRSLCNLRSPGTRYTDCTVRTPRMRCSLRPRLTLR
jgi:MmyB-like transcription regulator ligand binding domain